jgi:hypothetical protein
MDDFWGITILLFIILTLFVTFIVRVAAYYKKYKLVRHERVRMTDRFGTLKSGDIILFIAHTHGFTNSLFTGDLYTHSGMGVELGGELFLSEAAVDSLPNPVTGEEEMLPRTAQVNPLMPRLKHYPGMLFLMQLERRLTPSQEAILRERVLEETPYPSMVQMLKAMFRIPVHRKARHCMQHVSWLLDEMGLTPDDLAENGDTLHGTGLFRSSREVTTLSGRALGPGGTNAYGPVYELLFDADALPLA